MTGGILFLQGGILLVWEPKEGWHFCSCYIEKIKLLSKIVSEELLNPHQCYFSREVSLGYKLQDVKLQVWIDQIWSKSIQDVFSGNSSCQSDSPSPTDSESTQSQNMVTRARNANTCTKCQYVLVLGAIFAKFNARTSRILRISTHFGRRTPDVPAHSNLANKFPDVENAS